MDNEFGGNSIKNWDEDDRPREKLLKKGAQALTDAEILAILIGSGTKKLSAVGLARHILKEKGGIHQLARTSIQELLTINGIGEAKALTIKAAFELASRRQQNENIEKDFSNSITAANYLTPKLQDLQQETLYVLYLNRNNKLIDEKIHSVGDIATTIFPIKFILKEALQLLASGLILAHNHPSGNLTPSLADKEVTQKIKEGCKLMDINLLDHIIVSHKGYFSFADEGLI